MRPPYITTETGLQPDDTGREIRTICLRCLRCGAATAEVEIGNEKRDRRKLMTDLLRLCTCGGAREARDMEQAVARLERDARAWGSRARRFKRVHAALAALRPGDGELAGIPPKYTQRAADAVRHCDDEAESIREQIAYLISQASE